MNILLLKTNFTKNRHLIMHCFSLIIILLVVIITILAKPGIGSMWDSHYDSGKLLLNGKIPDLPAYPMWGYSLLAGILGKYIVLFQISIALVLLFLLSYHAKESLNKIKSAKLKLLFNPIILTILLIPWFFLQASYFSNSIYSQLVVAGYWVLIIAYKKDFNSKFLILSAILIGLGFNFRTEALITAILLILSLIIYNFKIGFRKLLLYKIIIFTIFFSVCLIPWLFYTKATIGKPILTTTNGGAVSYLGLGINPKNPWGIISNDAYVDKIARQTINKSPWSVEADDYFRRAYIVAVKENPIAFITRIVYGCKLMLIQGLFVPEMEPLFKFNDIDCKIADLFRNG